MYLKNISIQSFRIFRKTKIDFHYPRQRRKGAKLSYPNINVILGTNGFGKTTMLKAIALSCLGPAITDAGIYAYKLLRIEPKANRAKESKEANIKGEFMPNVQDGTNSRKAIKSHVSIIKKGDLEKFRWKGGDDTLWESIYSTESDAFFFVGYGSTRRVEKIEHTDLGSRSANSFIRAGRIKSLFEEAYSLIPLNAWLPSYESKNRGRYTQVVNLINRIMGKDKYNFTGEMEHGEYLFERNGLKIPFPALSDGYRAFLGWIGDLLYHICFTTPSGKKLVENCGIVMVDEIDLHLHPEWQKSILPTLANSLPKIQFIVTTHSPLVVGSVEGENIITMAPDKNEASKAKRIDFDLKGMDSDQILLTGLFGLDTTRSDKESKEIKELTKKTRTGDIDAAKDLMKMLIPKK